MKKVDYKWVMLALVSAAYFLAQGSRQIYAAVLPDIKAALGGNVSDTSLGLVGSAFTWAFGIMMPFAGLAADFFRRKWILVIGSLLFSIGILLSGFASGIGLLLIAYGIMNGVGQSLMPPCNSSLIGQFRLSRSHIPGNRGLFAGRQLSGRKLSGRMEKVLLGFRCDRNPMDHRADPVPKGHSECRRERRSVC